MVNIMDLQDRIQKKMESGEYENDQQRLRSAMLRLAAGRSDYGLPPPESLRKKAAALAVHLREMGF